MYSCDYLHWKASEDEKEVDWSQASKEGIGRRFERVLNDSENDENVTNHANDKCHPEGKYQNVTVNTEPKLTRKQQEAVTTPAK